MELARYLQPMIAGNVRPIPHNVDARLNNVLGYLKYAKHIWGNGQSDPIPETRPEPMPKPQSETVSESRPTPKPATEVPPELEPLEEAEEIAPLVDDDALEEIEDLVNESLSEYR
jgi:hypothetical protein